MISKLRELSFGLGRVNARQLRFWLIILSLLMFVIGAGAPGDHSGWGG